jgi:peroxiredoxin
VRVLTFTIFITSFLMCSSSFSKSLSEKLTERRNQSAKKVPAPMKAKMNAGVKGLKKTGLAKRSLGVGKKWPQMSLLNSKKKRVSLNEMMAGEISAITFYRGGWCPYCMLELDHYETMISDFEKAGVQIIAISPDSPMEALKTKKKRNLSYAVLSDPGNLGAKKLGLVFKVDEGTLGIYKKFGINLKKSQGNNKNELPMPGTYVVDKKGVIAFSFVDPDYTKRAEPADVLEVALKLSRSN